MMAIDAEQGFPGAQARTGAAGAYRDARDAAFARAARHTRLVRILRLACPAAAALILLLYFATSSIHVSIGEFDASVRRIEVNSDRLRMVDPRLEGMSKDKTPYTVTAEFAEQEIRNPSIVHLTALRADMDSATQGWTRITAPKGVFDTVRETLVLTGDIRIATASGMRSRLTHADIDMKTQRIVSNEPVAVAALNGTIDARRMEILMKEKRVIFRKDVKVHIFKRPAGAAQAGSRTQTQ